MTETSNLSPGQLSELLVVKSAEFSNLSDQLATILESKPKKWLQIREGTQSDTSAERQWNATAEGIAETTLKLKLKALEKEMSAYKTRLNVLSDEARNIY